MSRPEEVGPGPERDPDPRPSTAAGADDGQKTGAEGQGISADPSTAAPAPGPRLRHLALVPAPRHLTLAEPVDALFDQAAELARDQWSRRV